MKSAKSENKFPKLKLERKITLVFSFLVLFFGIAFTMFNYTEQEQIFLKEDEEESIVLIELLEANFAQPLAELKIDEIKFMFEYLFKNPKIKYAYVFDEKNQLMINGDKSGLYPEGITLDSLTINSLNANDLIVQYGDEIMNISTPIIYNNSRIGLLCLGISLDEIKLELKNQRDRNILVSLLFIMASIVLSIIFSKRITKPILKLKESISKTADGNYDQSIQLNTGDEIQTLAEAYNDMMFNLNEMKNRITRERDRAQKYLDIAGIMIVILSDEAEILLVNKKGLHVLGYELDEVIGKNWFDEFFYGTEKIKLKQYYKRIPKGIFNFDKNYQFHLKLKNENKIFNWNYSPVYDEANNIMGLICAGEDITEKKKAEQELIKAKELAENSDRLKSEFLAQMSHEIRTPVNTILNFNYLIKEETKDNENESISNYFVSLEIAGSRLIKTIDAILNMSQLETGTYESFFTNIDLYKDVIQKIEKEFGARAKTKNLEFIIEKNSQDMLVFADEYSLTQAFSNIIDNSIKYTNEGSITINLNKDAEENLIVKIKDTGIGMSPEFLENIFEPFTQEEQGYTRKFDGSGLGMSLVKRYLDINKSEIEIESKKHFGSTFTITLFKKNSIS